MGLDFEKLGKFVVGHAAGGDRVVGGLEGFVGLPDQFCKINRGLGLNDQTHRLAPTVSVAGSSRTIEWPSKCALINRISVILYLRRSRIQGYLPSIQFPGAGVSCDAS